jgi:NTE family protein
MPNRYHFRNLVFEGGGVKGIAYLGALAALEEQGVMAGVRRG